MSRRRAQRQVVPFGPGPHVLLIFFEQAVQLIPAGGDDRRELVAPDPVRLPLFPEALRDALRRADDQLVPGLVALAVVHFLQFVHVDGQVHQVFPRLLLRQLPDVVDVRAAIGKARQHVDLRVLMLLHDPLGQSLLQPQKADAQYELEDDEYRKVDHGADGGRHHGHDVDYDGVGDGHDDQIDGRKQEEAERHGQRKRHEHGGIGRAVFHRVKIGDAQGPGKVERRVQRVDHAQPQVPALNIPPDIHVQHQIREGRRQQGNIEFAVNPHVLAEQLRIDQRVDQHEDLQQRHDRLSDHGGAPGRFIDLCQYTVVPVSIPVHGIPHLTVRGRSVAVFRPHS